MLLAAGACAAAAAAADDGADFAVPAGLPLAGDTTLADILVRFGNAPIVEFGETGDYRVSICYALGEVQISFLSNSLGGSTHRLLGYSVARAGDQDAARCGRPQAAIDPGQVEPGGLHLGMRREEFAALMGAAPRWSGNMARKLFSSLEPMSGADIANFEFYHPYSEAPSFWHVSVSIFATFTEDRLSKFEVWRIKREK